MRGEERRSLERQTVIEIMNVYIYIYCFVFGIIHVLYFEISFQSQTGLPNSLVILRSSSSL